MGFINIYGTYVMYAMWEKDVSPRWRYASEDVDLYNRNSAHGHQPKGGRSCVDSARSTQDNTHVMFWRVPWCQRSRETLTIIITQSSIVEGSRLQKRGRVSASILACTNTLQSNLEPK